MDVGTPVLENLAHGRARRQRRNTGIEEGLRVRQPLRSRVTGAVDRPLDALAGRRLDHIERCELVATGRYLELSAFRIEPEERRQVAVLFQDVTARKRAEEARREGERLAERALRSLNRVLYLDPSHQEAAALLAALSEE